MMYRSLPLLCLPTSAVEKVLDMVATGQRRMQDEAKRTNYGVGVGRRRAAGFCKGDRVAAAHGERPKGGTEACERTLERLERPPTGLVSAERHRRIYCTCTCTTASLNCDDSRRSALFRRTCPSLSMSASATTKQTAKKGVKKGKRGKAHGRILHCAARDWAEDVLISAFPPARPPAFTAPHFHIHTRRSM